MTRILTALMILAGVAAAQPFPLRSDTGVQMVPTASWQGQTGVAGFYYKNGGSPGFYVRNPDNSEVGPLVIGGGSGSVTSISAGDSTVTVTPNPIVSSGNIKINLANANTWTASQTFTASIGINGGLTASGSSANDFSGSTGAFKTSTGASTFGGSSNSFTNGIANSSGAWNINGAGGIRLQFNGTTRWDLGVTTSNVITEGWPVAIIPAAQSGNVVPQLQVTSATMTTMTAGMDMNDVVLDPRSQHQWATGSVTINRSVIIYPTTVSFVGASTMQMGAQFDIEGPNLPGTNATIVTPLSVRVATGNSLFGDNSSTTGALTNSSLVGINTNPSYGLHTLGNRSNFAAIGNPTTLTVTPTGTTGTQRWDYRVVAKDAQGNTTLSFFQSTTTGNATLNGTNYNALSWTAVAGPGVTYDVYRLHYTGGSPTTDGSIALGITATSFNDQGGAASAYTLPTHNSTAEAYFGSAVGVGTTAPVGGVHVAAGAGGLRVDFMSQPTGVVLSGAGSSGGATTYTYSVVAVDSAGRATAQSTAATTAVGQASLSVSTPIVISWTAVTGAAGYHVIRVAGGATQGSIVLNLPPAASPSFSDTGLTASAYSNPTVTAAGNGAVVTSVVTSFGLSGVSTLQMSDANNDSIALGLGGGPIEALVAGGAQTIWSSSSSAVIPGSDNASWGIGLSSQRWKNGFFRLYVATTPLNVTPVAGFESGTGGFKADTNSPVGSLAVSNSGTAGSSIYTYVVVAKDIFGNASVCGVASTLTGNATLSGSNFNVLNWTATTVGSNGNPVTYDIIRIFSNGTPSSTGKVATIATGALTFNDQGGAASGYTIPTRNQTADVIVGGSLSVGTGNTPTASINVLGGGVVNTNLGTPATPTLSIAGGAAGSYTYYIVGRDAWGNKTLASSTVSTAVGPTTLDSSHNITVNWTALSGALTYDVVRSAGGASQGSIYTQVAGTSAIDYGLTATAYTKPDRDATGDTTTDGLIVNGGTRHARTTVADAAYTMTGNDYFVAYTSISAARTVTGLAQADCSSAVPCVFVIKDESGSASGTNTITFTPASGNIDGSATKVVVNAAFGAARLYCNGTNCFTY